MKIMYLIPTPLSQGRLGPKELARREAILRRSAAAGVELTVRDTPRGPSSIESFHEEYLSIPNAMEAVRQAELGGMEAVIMGCFGDPGVDGCREIASVPVVGPSESSMHFAAMLGYKFSIVTALDSVAPLIRRVVRQSGMESRLASIRGINTAVLDVAQDRTETVKRLVDCGRRAIDDDGADTLILGCMSLAFMEVSQEVSARLNVPVIDPACVSLKTAECLLSLKLSHSKKAFPLPPKISLATSNA